MKTDNKVSFVEQIIESVKQTQYINRPNSNFQAGTHDGQSQYITQKRIIIDDVNSFFSKFIEATRAGLPFKKEDDLMIQQITIDDELFKTKDEQLYKLLAFSFLILNQLIKNIHMQMQSQMRQQSHDKGQGNEGLEAAPDSMGNARGAEDVSSKKILYVMKITANLDPNLKCFLNSLKTALLMRTISLRLAIIEGEKCIAG